VEAVAEDMEAVEAVADTRLDQLQSRLLHTQLPSVVAAAVIWVMPNRAELVSQAETVLHLE
jgi:hypothetical protein